MPVIIPWFKREFSFDIPAGMFANVMERLRGTPARLEERLGRVPSQVLVRKEGDSWSIQENAGHLLDLEPLWADRVEDFAQGKEKLRTADLTNRRTHETRHNEAPLGKILSSFRAARAGLVSRLEALDEQTLARTALHPRLNSPMRVIDHAFFVAEHDDHHLARISELLRLFT
ncbi:MAG TPA: DinB family protein [Spirochaetia bacterium]|nr:DinB family protein [Spirochaetia bacterium]